jgi:outer membrane biosynthesis protein TonB
VVYLRQVDWPRRPAIDELPDRFVHEVVRAPARRPPAPPEPETTPDREPAPPPAADRPSRPARPDRPAPATAAERRAVIAEQVSRMGLLAVIGRRTPDGSAAIADLLASGAPDRAQEEAFRDIGGVSVATAERERRSLRPAGGGGPRLATPGALRGPGAIAAPAATGEVRERSARPHVRLDRPELDGGRGDPALLAREVRARLGAIRACYERALKQQPSLAGKLVVAFTITAAGTVSAVEIDEDTLSEAAPGMTACVRGSIRQWRFSPQGEGSVELRFPFVFQSSG